MKRTIIGAAALAVMLAGPAGAQEDQASRERCLFLLHTAHRAAGKILEGFKPPGLSIPAHTFRPSHGAQHCFFLSDDNKLLYITVLGGKAFGMTLVPGTPFAIPLE